MRGDAGKHVSSVQATDRNVKDDNTTEQDSFSLLRSV